MLEQVFSFLDLPNVEASGQPRWSMPLLDHFHPPLHGPRRWEGFHHAWATFTARQLNQEALPPSYFAEPEISLGPELEVDVATLEEPRPDIVQAGGPPKAYSPPPPAIGVKVDF